MFSIQKHLRNTLLAGIFGAIPVVITVFIVWWVDSRTRPVGHWVMAHFFGLDREVPFLGVMLAVVAIYLVGFATTSLLGKLILKLIDRLLLKLPLLGQLYLGWKQVGADAGRHRGNFLESRTHS